MARKCGSRGVVVSVVLVLGIMAVLLFIRNPFESHDRLNQALWNTGHLFFFAFAGWLLLSQTAIGRRGWLAMLTISLLFSLLFGGAIEVAQYRIGRYMEWQDLLTDLLGGLLGFVAALFCQSSQQRPALLKTNLRISASMGLIFLLAFYPVFYILLDDYRMAQRFPILADFESANELEHWESDHVARLEIDHAQVAQGHASLRVELSPAEFSAVTLQFFPADWMHYDQLHISVYNSQPEPLPVELKIFDQQHTRNDYRYDDRFNRELLLKPGWNHLKISLRDLYNAPRDRKMDLRNMDVISLFSYRLPAPVTIYLDNIYLSRKTPGEAPGFSEAP